MLDFPAAIRPTPTPVLNLIQIISSPLAHFPPITKPQLPFLTLNCEARRNPKKPRRFVIFAEKEKGFSEDPKDKEEIGKKENGNGNGKNTEKKRTDGGEEEDVRRNGRPSFSLRWVDLVLDPDPDNILAVGLTGILSWASVQVLWQILSVSLAVVVAALKYYRIKPRQDFLSCLSNIVGGWDWLFNPCLSRLSNKNFNHIIVMLEIYLWKLQILRTRI
ncbi:hypothetical protein NMG60_11020262 [Bertholletia excelsa]